MINRRRIAAEAAPLQAFASVEEAAVALKGHETRFASNDRAARLPGDTGLIAEALHALGTAEAGVAAAVLLAPVTRVPLSTPSEMGRTKVSTFAVVGVDVGPVRPDLLVVTTRLILSGDRFRPVAGMEVELERVAKGPAAAERLESLFQAVPAPARRVLPDGSGARPPHIMWVGGATGGALPFDAADRISAAAAVRGHDATLFDDAGRRAPSVLTAVKDRPPEVLVVWRPHASRVAAISAFGASSTTTSVVDLDEWEFDLALDELRLHLDDLPEPTAAQSTPPAPGDVRYFIKTAGSAVGDLMVAVPDCGHNQWSDDSRQKAPRARKGIERLTGATLQHLARCNRCKKNRWKARF